MTLNASAAKGSSSEASRVTGLSSAPEVRPSIDGTSSGLGR